MGPFRFLLLFFFLGVVAAESPQTLLRTMAQVAAASDDLYCDSWRLSVETNNARFWRTVPFRCREFVQEYMSGARYASDTDVVVDESLAFARSVQIANDGNDAWIFDVDETLLSNVPYYAINGFGTKVFNETSFNEWVDEARAPALAASLRLYEELLVSGFQIILLTGEMKLKGRSLWRIYRTLGTILGEVSYLGRTLIWASLRWSSNQKGGQGWKLKDSGFWPPQGINGVTCWGFPWPNDLLNTQIPCITSVDL